jgi:hypothetical protein
VINPASAAKGGQSRGPGRQLGLVPRLAGLAEKLSAANLEPGCGKARSPDRPSASAREHIDTNPRALPKRSPTKAVLRALEGKAQVSSFLVAGKVAAMLPFLNTRMVLLTTTGNNACAIEASRTSKPTGVVP